MANDIIFLRCCYCGAGLPLTKYYLSTNLGDLDPRATPDVIAMFLATHLRERDLAGWRCGADLQGTPGLEFVTEDPQSSRGQLYLGPERRPYWAYPFPPTPAELARHVV